MGELIVLFGLFIGGAFAIKALVGERAWADMCAWGRDQVRTGMEEFELAPSSSESLKAKDAEIDALKKRIETLEAIVTDPRYNLRKEINDL